MPQKRKDKEDKMREEKISKREKNLLDAIDEEQEKPDEEKIEIRQAEFDPVKKIASIIQNNETGRPMGKAVPGSMLDIAIMAHYFLDSPSENELEIAARDPQGMHKMIIKDVAHEMDARAGEYLDIKRDMVELTLRISSKIYSSFFDKVSPIIYSAGEGVEKIRVDPEDIPPLEETIERYQDPLFKYENINPIYLMASIGFLSYFKNNECIDRIRFVDNIPDLKYLKLIDLYLNLIKNENYKEDMVSFLKDNSKSIKNIAIYATITLHKDFFRFMSKDYT